MITQNLLKHMQEGQRKPVADYNILWFTIVLHYQIARKKLQIAAKQLDCFSFNFPTLPLWDTLESIVQRIADWCQQRVLMPP